jgi:hypothetical protein
LVIPEAAIVNDAAEMVGAIDFEIGEYERDKFGVIGGGADGTSTVATVSMCPWEQGDKSGSPSEAGSAMDACVCSL